MLHLWYPLAKGIAGCAHLLFEREGSSCVLAIPVFFNCETLGEPRRFTAFKPAHRFFERPSIPGVTCPLQIGLHPCCYRSSQRIPRALLFRKLRQPHAFLSSEVRRLGGLRFKALPLYSEDIIEARRPGD